MTDGSRLPEEAALLEVDTDQIKHRDRVRDLAEVYTHYREVTAMLDLVSDMFPSDEDPDRHDRTFLEPACGHGNFLVEILRRKLRTVTPTRYGTGDEYEHRVLRCLTSVYGIDIDQENVLDSRHRMNAAIAAHIVDPDARSVGFWSAVETILGTNIVRADTLADAQKIELVAYTPAKD
ncbi:MAG: type III restriction endonuclease subunit M, partial [Mycobacterium sp.]